MKKIFIAIVVVFVAWSVLDFLIHGLILKSAYDATAEIWRPMEDMNMSLMYLITLIYAALFVSLYAILVSPKSLATGVKYGAIFGLAAGVSMGFGSYCYIPIPLHLAWAWFGGTVIKSLIAGIIIGAIVTTPERS